MTAARQSALHHGWVLVSYFLIFGGLFAAAIVSAALDLDSSMTPYAVTLAGAVLGGWFTGRLCRLGRIGEPLTASVAMTVSIVACTTSTDLGPALWDEPTLVIVGRSFLLGGCAFVGALVGALVGRARWRGRRDVPHSAAWHWVGVSTLVTLGAMGLAFLVWVGVFSSHSLPGNDRESGSTLIMFLVLGAVSVLGGFITQVLADRRMPRVTGIGGAIGILSLGALGAFNNGKHEVGSILIGGLVLAVVFWPLGRIGAGLGWRAREHHLARTRRALPDAQKL